MLRDLRHPATIAVLIASAQFVAATQPPTLKSDMSQGARRVADALCGRPSQENGRAEALDHFTGDTVPDLWQKSTVSDLDAWLEAPQCEAQQAAESDKYRRRRAALNKLRNTVDAALSFHDRQAALTPLPRWRPVRDVWPSDAECAGCLRLRVAATALDKAASEWPKPSDGDDTPIGRRLDSARQRQALIQSLCAAKPSLEARKEIESRFRYYTWTANGAQLLNVAQWFQRLDDAGMCLGQ